MASYNRIIIMGNLTRDPEYRQLTSGQSVTRLGLASNRQFKNRQTGTMTQEVCFVDIDVWGAQAESCNRYLQKGRAVLVEGRLKFDTWEDNKGQRRSKHFIVADRVTFLASQQSTDSDYSNSSSFDSSNNQKQVENKNDLQFAKSEKSISLDDNSDKKAPNIGEINFKDEKPFEDDLPF